jgi:LCP family protein required for cell wall assembly
MAPPQPGRVIPRRVLKWVGLVALAWILISFLAFGISAQIQSFKLSGEAGKALHGNPFLLPSAQTILVLGTDARPPGAGDGNTSKECFEQQSKGEKPHKPCYEGEFRADTLMLIRAGGGTFNKLSIPRDSFAAIPGHDAQKINAAYALDDSGDSDQGNTDLMVQTVEGFLGVDVDHVVLVDFEGFESFIDAIGGVEVDVPDKLCSVISGGEANGGFTKRIGPGEETLDGEDALIFARTRSNACPEEGGSTEFDNYDDLDRAAAQQEVLSGIKARLTSPLRLPINFLKGPIIGWTAPQAFVSNMGALSMPQLVLSSVVAGSGETDVLCSGANSGCSSGASGISVPESEKKRAVKALTD